MQSIATVNGELINGVFSCCGCMYPPASGDVPWLQVELPIRLIASFHRKRLRKFLLPQKIRPSPSEEGRIDQTKRLIGRSLHIRTRALARAGSDERPSPST